ncbi:MAG: membrane protein insertion efficiency factor YidD [Candidatus Omnitrophota bacterium]|nr:membrane protein insertion efficiency factor YidD [Candidatus Omnitrophota bacterium]
MREIALFLIKIYRKVAIFRFSRCCYVPTCSEYAQEAFSRYPFFKASKLVLFRIARCNPLVKGGFDPVE